MIKTRFTELAGIQWPIVQAPMIGGYSSPEMVAAVSSLGCLGTLALGNSSPENIDQLCLETMNHTDQPFAVNFFVSQNTTIPSPAEKSEAIKSLQPYYQELGIDPAFLYQKALTQTPELNAQVEAVIGLGVPIVTFTFGIPDKAIINKLKRNGIMVIGTATNRTEAALVEGNGFDAVILQGIGAGGHRASFLSDGTTGPSTTVLNQKTGDLTIPRVITGGIMNGQHIAEYINQGADACQLGSAYLFTDEAKLEDYYLAALKKSQSGTCLSKSFTGKYARVVRNKFTREMKDQAVLNFPFQGQLTMDMRIKAAAFKEYGVLPFWSGESASVGERQTTTCLTKKLIDECKAELSNMPGILAC